MPFQIPQFIEREPKVVGPFTFKQFVYLAVPGAIAFFLYFTVSFTLFIVGTLVLGGLGFALGFLRLGAKSLPGLLMDVLRFSASPKTYVWKKGVPSEAKASEGKQEYQRTPQQEAVAKQVGLGKESAVQKLGTQVQTK